MTKTQSKKVKQLKYLLLIPLLGSMVLYTACSDNGQSPIQTKENRKIMYSTKKSLKVNNTPVPSYMDVYLGGDIPDTKELSFKDLTDEEVVEYQSFLNRAKENGREMVIRIFEGVDNPNRKIMFLDLEATIKKYKYSKETDSNNVPIAIVDKVPTYPGCDEGDKDCLNKSIQRFVLDNFDASISKELGMSKGKKRIYVQFKIDKQGNVIDIKARAPHPALKQHAEEVVSKLPQMLPGEYEGKIVKVGYTLPITFNVE